jgi:hypothetical protein
MSHTCSLFPSRTECEHDERGYRDFCVLWHSAGYLSQIGAMYGIVAMVAMLAATMSRARRRGLWKVVAGLVGLRGECTDGVEMGIEVSE